jgi:hypothetical protein
LPRSFSRASTTRPCSSWPSSISHCVPLPCLLLFVLFCPTMRAILA